MATHGEYQQLLTHLLETDPDNPDLHQLALTAAELPGAGEDRRTLLTTLLAAAALPRSVRERFTRDADSKVRAAAWSSPGTWTPTELAEMVRRENLTVRHAVTTHPGLDPETYRAALCTPPTPAGARRVLRASTHVAPVVVVEAMRLLYPGDLPLADSNLIAEALQVRGVATLVVSDPDTPPWVLEAACGHHAFDPDVVVGLGGQPAHERGLARWQQGIRQTRSCAELHQLWASIPQAERSRELAVKAVCDDYADEALFDEALAWLGPQTEDELIALFGGDSSGRWQIPVAAGTLVGVPVWTVRYPRVALTLLRAVDERYLCDAVRDLIALDESIAERVVADMVTHRDLWPDDALLLITTLELPEAAVALLPAAALVKAATVSPTAGRRLVAELSGLHRPGEDPRDALARTSALTGLLDSPSATVADLVAAANAAS